MKSLESYSRLTLRISKEPVILWPKRNNGHGYRYFVRCDEIPGCCAHGSTIADAVKYFQEMAELWSSWFDNLYPQDKKV